jgi:hypothetical protein
MSSGDDYFVVSAQQWNVLCAYLAALDTQLHMLQCYVKFLRALMEAILDEAEY